MSVRPQTYGELELVNNRWVLSNVPPHVAIRLKSMFARIPKEQTGTFDLPFTSEMSADLAWFMERYPMAMSSDSHRVLERQKQRFEDDRAAREAILLPSWKPEGALPGFRPGYAPYPGQRQAIELYYKRKGLLVADEGGGGKEQPLSSRILTPTGWVTMRDIRVGQEVISRDGSSSRVTAVHPQGCKPAYRLTFSDGSQAECGINHLWIVRDANRRLRGKGWTTKSLRELVDGKVTYRNGYPKWEIPLVEPVVFAEQVDPLPVDPYLLGLLLGDGSICGEQIALSIPHHEEETLRRVQGIVGEHRVTGPFGGSCPQWHILGETKTRNSIFRAIKRMGLRVKGRQKFIPECYLRGTVEERKDLLRGLMDADGSSRNNRIHFHSSSRALAEGVRELVQSLGGTARIRTHDRSKEGKNVEYRVNVKLQFAPFRLSRKVSEWRPCPTNGRGRRYILSIEYIGDVEQQCISVAANDGSYITDNYVVTHNTWVAMGAMVGSPFLPAAVVVDANLAIQWQDEFIKPHTYLTSHIIESTTPYDLPSANCYIFKYSNIAGWEDIAGTGIFKQVILDEIQAGRTGTTSKKGRAMKVFADNAEMRMGLSATFFFNYGSEAWNIMQYIDPDILGPWEEFVREWCKAERGKWLVSDPDALGSYLRECTVVIRRKGQGRKVNRLVVNVDYDDDVAAESEDLARSLAMKVVSGHFTESGQAARELDALARHTTGVAKARSVAAYVRILLEQNVPVILAGWHHDVYEIWKRELAEFNPVMVTGRQTAKQKAKAKKTFIEGGSNLYIISLRAGQGIDGLQKRCKTIVIGELDWAPPIYDQIVWRVDRPGQPSDDIDVLFCVSEGGSDPTMMSVNAIKRDQSRGIHDPGEGPPPVQADVQQIKMLAQAYLGQQP